MLLDEKEAEVDAHEAEKDALWRRIEEMATRVAELEQESAEARSMCELTRAAVSEENGLNHAPASLAGNSLRSSRAGVETTKLRAKNDVLETQLAAMRDQLEETRIELTAARKARLYYKRVSRQSRGGSSRSSISPSSSISPPPSLRKCRELPSASATSSLETPDPAAYTPSSSASFMAAPSTPPRVTGVSTKVAVPLIRPAKAAVFSPPHASPGEGKAGVVEDDCRDADPAPYEASKMMLKSLKDNGSNQESETTHPKMAENNLDATRLLEQNASLMTELDSKDELIEALRQQLKQQQYEAQQRSVCGRSYHQHDLQELSEGDLDSDKCGDENEDPDVGVRERSFMDDLIDDTSGNPADIIGCLTIKAPEAFGDENRRVDPIGAVPPAPEKRRSFGGLLAENVPLGLSPRRNEDPENFTKKGSKWAQQIKSPFKAGRENLRFWGNKPSSPSPAAEIRDKAGSVTGVVSDCPPVAEIVAPSAKLTMGALETWPASPRGVPLSWSSAMRALAMVVRVGQQPPGPEPKPQAHEEAEREAVQPEATEVGVDQLDTEKQTWATFTEIVKPEEVEGFKAPICLESLEKPNVAMETEKAILFLSAKGNKSISPESSEPEVTKNAMVQDKLSSAEERESICSTSTETEVTVEDEDFVTAEGQVPISPESEKPKGMLKNIVEDTEFSAKEHMLAHAKAMEEENVVWGSVIEGNGVTAVDEHECVKREKAMDRGDPQHPTFDDCNALSVEEQEKAPAPSHHTEADMTMENLDVVQGSVIENDELPAVDEQESTELVNSAAVMKEKVDSAAQAPKGKDEVSYLKEQEQEHTPPQSIEADTTTVYNMKVVQGSVIEDDIIPIVNEQESPEPVNSATVIKKADSAAQAPEGKDEVPSEEEQEQPSIPQQSMEARTMDKDMEIVHGSVSVADDFYVVEVQESPDAVNAEVAMKEKVDGIAQTPSGKDEVLSAEEQEQEQAPQSMEVDTREHEREVVHGSVSLGDEFPAVEEQESPEPVNPATVMKVNSTVQAPEGKGEVPLEEEQEQSSTPQQSMVAGTIDKDMKIVNGSVSVADDFPAVEVQESPNVVNAEVAMKEKMDGIAQTPSGKDEVLSAEEQVQAPQSMEVDTRQHEMEVVHRYVSLSDEIPAVEEQESPEPVNSATVMEKVDSTVQAPEGKGEVPLEEEQEQSSTPQQSMVAGTIDKDMKIVNGSVSVADDFPVVEVQESPDAGNAEVAMKEKVDGIAQTPSGKGEVSSAEEQRQAPQSMEEDTRQHEMEVVHGYVSLGDAFSAVEEQESPEPVNSATVMEKSDSTVQASKGKGEVPTEEEQEQPPTPPQSMEEMEIFHGFVSVNDDVEEQESPDFVNAEVAMKEKVNFIAQTISGKGKFFSTEEQEQPPPSMEAESKENEMELVHESVSLGDEFPVVEKQEKVEDTAQASASKDEVSSAKEQTPNSSPSLKQNTTTIEKELKVVQGPMIRDAEFPSVDEQEPWKYVNVETVMKKIDEAAQEPAEEQGQNSLASVKLRSKMEEGHATENVQTRPKKDIVFPQEQQNIQDARAATAVNKKISSVTAAKTKEATTQPPATKEPQPIAEPRDLGCNRAERKSRQAMAKLGLRAVPGVFRVTLKASSGNHFVVQNPDVFKHPKQNTYLIFGTAEASTTSKHSGGGVEIPSASRRVEAEAFSVPAPAKFSPYEMPKVPSSANREAVEVRSASDGIDPADVLTVVSHTGCDSDAAIKALRQEEGDVVNAVMRLTEA